MKYEHTAEPTNLPRQNSIGERLEQIEKRLDFAQDRADLIRSRIVGPSPKAVADRIDGGQGGLVSATIRIADMLDVLIATINASIDEL